MYSMYTSILQNKTFVRRKLENSRLEERDDLSIGFVPKSSSNKKTGLSQEEKISEVAEQYRVGEGVGRGMRERVGRCEKHRWTAVLCYCSSKAALCGEGGGSRCGAQVEWRKYKPEIIR